MRDFLPEEASARARVRRTIEEVFQRYGFDPLETPACERIETLLGKYGEEGDQLLFKILKRGEGSERGEVDMGLRYDLTVPLARVVAMHPAQIQLPFRRYQIQPVWRADRPQRGRFREFVQCDVDIVGVESIAADAELIAVADAAFRALGLTDYRMRINHRAVLRGMIEAAGVAHEREGDVLVAVDKLDKIGPDGVHSELVARGFPTSVADRIGALLRARDAAPEDGLAVIEEFAGSTDAGRHGLAELRDLVSLVGDYGLDPGRWRVDPVLARGLSYYTGPVFEANLEGMPGSVAGGGRYDGLVGMFSGRDIPATGIALGFERLVVLLSERGAFEGQGAHADVLVAVLSATDRSASTRLSQTLRAHGLNVELYPEDRKVGAQLKYASRRGIPFAVLSGPDERSRGEVQLKDLRTGEQASIAEEDLVERLRSALTL
jgi:histidyl-tRNA synthetase